MRWELLDRQLVDRVARVAGVDQKLAASLDEHARHWWQWAIAGMSYVSPYGYSTPAQAHEMDEDFVHDITMRLIQRAAESGNCVIVGRGAQCFLHGRRDVLNVLAYAPIRDRLRRLRARQPECADLEALVKRVDRQRAGYVRQHYRKDWLDKSLYDLCINTSLGLEVAAELITTAISRAKQNRNLTCQQPHSAGAEQANHADASAEGDGGNWSKSHVNC
jgi:cytidylate kinase